MTKEERFKYMNDFAQLLIELANLRQALSGVEQKLGKLNEVYLKGEHRESNS